jgi:acetyltransferase-like isoleucine patch superfamily enzyme
MLVRFFTKLWFKLCLTLARIPVSYKWPVFWWRRCGFSIGKNVNIGPYCLLWANYHSSLGEIIIEDFVTIGPNVTLVSVSHSKADIAKHGKVICTTEGKIRIKQGSWIGAGAIVLPNVTINEGSVVGAGSVVTRDVEAHTVVAGAPAKKIGLVGL